MGLFKGSRYRDIDVIQGPDAEGAVETVYTIRKTTVPAPTGSQPYTTKAGDTMEKLSFDRYGDANKWYVIADANPQIFFPLDLEAGLLIYLPPKSYALTV